MAGRRSRRSRRRSRRIRSRRVGISRNPAVFRNPPNTGGRRLGATRSLEFYPASVDPNASTPTPTKSWLQYIAAIGTYAMKLFIMSWPLTDTEFSSEDLAHTGAIVGAVQSLLVGPEDLLSRSPVAISSDLFKGLSVQGSYVVNYRQAKIDFLKICVSAGAKSSELAGRMAVAVVPLTYGESSSYFDGFGRFNSPEDIVTFDQLIMYPGAVVSPFRQPISITWRPRRTDWASEFQQIGQTLSDVQSASLTSGSFPCVKVLIGYQDFSNTSADPVAMYGEGEALLHVDLHGSLRVRDNMLRVCRGCPLYSMDFGRAGIMNRYGAFVGEISLSQISRTKSGLLLVSSDVADFEMIGGRL